MARFTRRNSARIRAIKRTFAPGIDHIVSSRNALDFTTVPSVICPLAEALLFVCFQCFLLFKKSTPPSAYRSFLNCLDRSSAVTRVSGALLLAFLACGAIDLAIFSFTRAQRCALFRIPRKIANSISECEFHPFSVIAENHWLYLLIAHVQSTLCTL